MRTTILRDGAVLVDIEGRRCLRLNRQETLIWLRLCQGNSVAEIAHEVNEHFGYTADVVCSLESFVVECSPELFSGSLPLPNGEGLVCRGRDKGAPQTECRRPAFFLPIGLG
jgi:hypothetical protein